MVSSLITGRVIWITGLSGAGKSTLTRELVDRLRGRGDQVVMLDGDELREVFGAAATNVDSHGRERRLALAMQYAHLYPHRLHEQVNRLRELAIDTSG